MGLKGIFVEKKEILLSSRKARIPLKKGIRAFFSLFWESAAETKVSMIAGLTKRKNLPI